MDYDQMDLRSIPKVFLHAINKLPQFVGLTADCYVHTLNSQLELNKISCLKSLRVCLVNTPLIPHHGGDSYRSFEGNVSLEVAAIIRQNPCLEALHLCLETGQSPMFIHECYQEASWYALEYIGCVLPRLHSLTLGGDLLFSHVAWLKWNTTVDWSHLRSLSITSMSLIESTLGCLKGHLPALRRLQLSAYESLHCFPHSNFHKDSIRMRHLLSGLDLTHLSMLGFHPDILLSNIEPVGSKLQNIRFHIQERPSDLAIVRGPPFTELLLSEAHIAVLQSRCTDLSWIGLDVPCSSLEGANRNIWSQFPAASDAADLQARLPVLAQLRQLTNPSGSLPQGPQPGPVPSVQPPYGSPAFNSSLANPVLASAFHRQLLIPEGDTPSAGFNSLRNLPLLRHIRLFVHQDQNLPWNLSNRDAVATFERLRSRKCGSQLESLVICGARRAGIGLWIIWELGPQMATLEHHGNRKGEDVREVWKSEDGKLSKQAEYSLDEWRAQPEWGVSEGW